MLVRVGNAKDVTAGEMRVFDVAGTKVNVASAGGHRFECYPIERLRASNSLCGRLPLSAMRCRG